MSHVEETTQELSNPCPFCGEGETCRHDNGCEYCCWDCRDEKDKVDAGRNAAIREVAEAVAEYKRAPEPKDPWEEWLPRLLDSLALGEHPGSPAAQY